MFSTPIEAVISAAGSALITNIAIFLMIFIFIAAVILRKGGKSESFTQYTPSLLTSLGIFGTFCGIVVGLLEFDIKDIDGSIDLLLAGMKTAFTTSLVGMLLSIIFKFLISVNLLTPAIQPRKTKNSIGIVDLYESMEGQRDGIFAVYNAIDGNTENSLIRQINILREENNQYFDWQREHNKTMQRHGELQIAWQQKADNRSETQLDAQLRQWDRREQQFQDFQQELKLQLQELTETLSKSATEQVINALQQVIKDFNEKLTEQFGENFKQLNNAVIELVTWQENYKIQLAQMRDQFSHTVKSMETTAVSIAKVDEHTQAIPSTMKDLQTILTTNQNQINELTRHLNAFQEAHDKAVNAVPKINSLLTETIESINTGTQNLVSGMTSSNDKIGSAVIAFDTGMQSTRIQIEKTLQDTTKRQAEEANSIFNGLRKSIEGSLSDTQEAVEKQVNLIDKSMEHDVAKVMTEMGRALTSISGKFTEDYQKLVHAMQNIVRQGQ